MLEYRIKNNKFNKLCIKNRTFYYFNHNKIIRLEDFGIDNILIDEKAHYGVSYKTLIGGKPLRIRFSKIDTFFGSFDGTRYLGLFGSEKYDTVYNKIRYLVILKSSITYVFSLYYAKAKVDSYDSLTIEKK